tara:strand:+ start:2372 stop:2536 length:165 start_codon:yes stop_codon:yes gene_type:complete
MPTPQELLNTEKAELQPLIEEFNGVAATQQEKLQAIRVKEGRIELLEQLVAEGG